MVFYTYPVEHEYLNFKLRMNAHTHTNIHARIAFMHNSEVAIREVCQANLKSSK